MNLGAITMLNQIKNGVVEQTATKKNGNNSE